MTTSVSQARLVASAEAPQRPRLRLIAGVVALLGLSAWRLLIAPTPDAPAPVTEVSGASMGTTYSVKIAGALERSAYEQVERAVVGALEQVDAAASTYREDSELRRFNRFAEVDTPFPLSPLLLPIVEIALQAGKQSAGALDVTVGPLVDAWGFGPRDERNPSPEAISALRANVGLHLLRLDGNALEKHRAEVALDLSAIAKGYAVDHTASALEALGYKNFLVEVGGELTARGVRADGKPWQVGIEKPVSDAREVERIVALKDMSMATSGDYRNFYEVDGRRRSHIIDPRSGRPIEHALASVTVMHPQAAVADAWATALTVLGPTEGPKVAEREGLLAFFVVREGPEAFRPIESPAFAHAASGDRP